MREALTINTKSATTPVPQNRAKSKLTESSLNPPFPIPVKEVSPPPSTQDDASMSEIAAEIPLGRLKNSKLAAERSRMLSKHSWGLKHQKQTLKTKHQQHRTTNKLQ